MTFEWLVKFQPMFFNVSDEDFKLRRDLWGGGDDVEIYREKHVFQLRS